MVAVVVVELIQEVGIEVGVVLVVVVVVVVVVVAVLVHVVGVVGVVVIVVMVIVVVAFGTQAALSNMGLDLQGVQTPRKKISNMVSGRPGDPHSMLEKAWPAHGRTRISTVRSNRGRRSSSNNGSGSSSHKIQAAA